MSSDGPKTAFELAMERLRLKDQEAGVAERSLTEDQKVAIGEIRKFYEAKVAEREILHRDAVRKARSHEEIVKLNDELAQDTERLARERERRIAEVRER